MNSISNTLLKVILVILPIWSFSLSAQDLFSTIKVADVPCAPVIANIDGRQTTSLNGTWNALIDPSIFSLNDLCDFVKADWITFGQMKLMRKRKESLPA